MSDQFTLPQAIELFAEVKKSLEISKSLQWTLSIDAMKAMLQNIAAEETLRFIDEYLMKVLQLMTSQSPSKLGPFERKVMDESIFISLRVMMDVLPNKPHHIIVISRLFDAMIPYYNGAKIGYQYFPGFPGVRILMAKRFAEINGFTMLAGVFKMPTFEWPGCDVMLNILRTMNVVDILNTVEDDIKIDIVNTMMKKVLSMTDDQLKKEHADILGQFIHILGSISMNIHVRACQATPATAVATSSTNNDAAGCMRRFQQFWFENTFKVMNSGSLVLKLFAWEQLGDIISDARLTRPIAKNIIVSGAGTEFVNGSYNICARTSPEADVVQYSKPADGPDVPLLTLFRCTMRTKAKWWFISQADLEKPGTDKDIDFYLHKSSPDDEREPPSRNWTRVNPGITLIGADPAPIMKRGEPLIPEGKTKDDYFDEQLLKFCAEKEILKSVFGASMHREILARSGKLLIILAEYDVLKGDDLCAIWKAAMTSQEVDIVEEVFALLVPLATFLSDDLFATLIDLALAALAKKTEDNYPRVAQFTEKFAMDHFRHISGSSLTEKSSSKLLSLVWEVYKNPGFESLKNNSALQSLLSHCFSQKGGIAMATQRIMECKTSLESFAEKSAAADGLLDEVTVSRMVQTLYFLISKHTSAEMVIKLNGEGGLPTCVIGEIKRYVVANRKRLAAGKVDAKTFSSGLRDRLLILRGFYGIDQTTTIPFASVQALGDLLSSSPIEMDEFFLFLKSSGSNSQEAMVSNDDALNIFKTIICSPTIDWSQCGDGAFECFSAFFTELENAAKIFPVDTELPPKLGLETLWRIALSIGTVSATTNSINLLLDAYEALSFRDDDAYLGMLQIVFSHLNEAATATNSGEGDSAEKKVFLSINDQVKVSRCISILSSAMAKAASGSTGGGGALSHAVRGKMSRINVSVYYRRISSYYNPNTQSDVVRPEKGSEGMVRLEIHPLHTVRQLKERINSIAGLGVNAASISIDHHQNNPFAVNKIHNQFPIAHITDSTRVVHLGLVDDSELSVSYQLSYNQHKTYSEEDRFDNIEDNANMNIGQLLANDYSQFDCLLTMCELSQDEELTRNIWQLLMLLPTQVDLVQQSVEQICFPEGVSASPLTPRKSNSNWNQIMRNSTATRKTYLLQIVDNMLQPAPEVTDPNAFSKSLEFKEAFLATGGFQMVLNNLIAADSNDGIISTTGLAVSLHIVHFLLFGSHSDADPALMNAASSASLANMDDSIVSVSNMDEVVPMGSPIANFRDTSNLDGASDVEDSIAEELLQQMEPHSALLIEKLLNVARVAAANQVSGVVQNALMVIAKLIKNPGAASQLTSNPESETLLRTVLRSAAKKVREMASEFAVQVGRNQPVVFDWLLHELKQLSPSDENCSEIFSALSSLLYDLQSNALINGTEPAADFVELASILSDKLTTYPRKKLAVAEERCVLLGYLETLENLLNIHPKSVLQTPLGLRLVDSFLSEFLFRMPAADEDGNDASTGPICDNPQTRQAAFNVLAAYLNLSHDGFERVLDEFNGLSKLAARHMHYNWGLQVSHDIKKPDMQFTGLKNQGCTCYMNSLLQVLFMNTAFREAILATPLLEIHRTTLWHRSDLDIVGEFFLFEWFDGKWRLAQVIGFDAASSRHRVQYNKNDGSIDEVAAFILHEGRFQRETGRVKVVPPDVSSNSNSTGDDSSSGGAIEPITEREEAAYRVLDHLQRAFCFMKYSKRRFFDPRPLVDACKTLNLNFSVYHQNDAAEFCDQLLDRIETATKGKHTKCDTWNNTFQKEIFGGKFLYQKIPQDCEAFNEEKSSCGHWQSSRAESYLKIELVIRGKEKIEESLDELMQGELMDGDNKINCDVCMQKKATVRRTCLGVLPPVLMLHLKRFDLDFQTFETVKLNNRMEFPTRINMLRYTKEGIEAEERKQRRAEAAAAAAVEDSGGEVDKSSSGGSGVNSNNSGSPAALQYETDDDGADRIDPDDYEYELQGVLVHAGIAQGGHYYSYIKDPNTPENWYKFDDDEVTPFNPQNIPLQCFGGPFSAHGMGGNSHSHNSIEEDRSSNALILLYSRVKSTPFKSSPKAHAGTSNSSETSSGDADSSLQQQQQQQQHGLRMVDGTEAYRREVRESNLQHILSCYLLDPDSHAFVRGLLSAVTKYKQDKDRNIRRGNDPTTPTATAAFDMSDLRDVLDGSPYRSTAQRLQWSPIDASDDLPLRTVQFGCRFLLDVVLHCRERAATRAYVNMLRDAFEAYPHTAIWFVSQSLDSPACSWMSDYLLTSTDALARGTFVQILVQAVAVVAPKDSYALEKYKQCRFSEIREAALQHQEAAGLVAFLVRQLLDHMFRAVNHVRTSDELFVLIRDLAAIPCVCYSMQGLGMISFLSYFVMPEMVPQMSRQMFERHLSPQRANARQLEYGNLLQSVFEAMAALLGVPQLRKVNLLQERNYWETDLVPDAREALTTIFFESSHNNSTGGGNGMDNNDIMRYFDKVTGGTGQKATPLQIRNILDRFSTTSDGRLSLDGFLQYHSDTASFNPKNVWRDLHAFGYRNDLSRARTAAALAPVVPTDSVPTTATVDTSFGNGDIAAVAATDVSFTDLDAVPPDAAEVLNITENCRTCLSSITLFESGLTASEAAARAIAKRVCLNDEAMSSILIEQALHKLLAVSSENTWNQHPLVVINDFLRLLLSIEDGLQATRLKQILLTAKVGLAIVALVERRTPSNCLANEHNNKFLYDRYIGFVQDLTLVAGVVDCLAILAQEDAKIKFVRGHLRLRPGYMLTENEDNLVRNTVVLVEGAGAKEVNGEYHFKDVKFNAGYYSRRGSYEGNAAAFFTLYKCSLKNGGFQWFLSVTPEGMEPGTNNDIDFYYAMAKPADKLPAQQWHRLNTIGSKDPPPHVSCIRLDAVTAAAAGDVLTTRGSGSSIGSGSSAVRPGRGVTTATATAPLMSTGTAQSTATASTALPESSDSEDGNFQEDAYPSSYVPDQYD